MIWKSSLEEVCVDVYVYACMGNGMFWGVYACMYTHTHIYFLPSNVTSPEAATKQLSCVSV
jgi:hypothetical protein